MVTTLEKTSLIIAGSGDTQLQAKILDYERIEPKEENIARHDIPSLGLTIPNLPLESVIVSLQQSGYGWYSVDVIADPYYGQQQIYDSHSELGAIIPVEQHEQKAREVYDKLLEIVRQGHYILHIFPRNKIALEEKI